MHRTAIISPAYSDTVLSRFETATAIATELNLYMRDDWDEAHDASLTAADVAPYGGFPGWWSFLAQCAAVFDAFEIPDDDWVEAILDYSSRVRNEIGLAHAAISNQQLALLMGLVAERIHQRSVSRSKQTAGSSPPLDQPQSRRD
jgi:hypothetical protein